MAEGVATGRLPSVTEDEVVEVNTDATDPQPLADGGLQTPLTRFAVPFENPEGKPLLSFVLIDTNNNHWFCSSHSNQFVN